jgi:hypothetical protein
MELIKCEIFSAGGTLSRQSAKAKLQLRNGQCRKDFEVHLKNANLRGLSRGEFFKRKILLASLRFAWVNAGALHDLVELQEETL